MPPRAKRKASATTPTATFDVPVSGAYAPGATATITTTRPAGLPLSAVVAFLGFTDIQVSANVASPTPTVTAKDGRTYALASDDGTTAKFTTKA